jgi:tRNA-2-methylthio-N6-dimethylallyladenosine synthase
MTGQIDEAVKSERLARLQQAIDQSQSAFNHGCLGRTLGVLFERPGRYSGQLVGRSPYLQPVQAAAPATLIGEIAAVTITEISSNSLFGVLAEGAPRAAVSRSADAAAVSTGA